VAERLDGSWEKSAKSFRLAGQACADPVDALRFQTGAIDSLGRAGRVDAAEGLARRLVKGLEDHGDARGAALACLNWGNALLWHDRYRQARSAFGRALRSFGPDDPLRPAALLGAATGELYGGDPRLAESLGKEAHAGFLQVGSPTHAAQALVTKGRAELLLGRPEEALRSFQEAQSGMEPDSTDFARCEEFLGDAYFRLNLWSEAAHAYVQAAGHSALQGSLLNRGSARLGLASTLEQDDKTAEAETWARKAVADFHKFGNDAWTAHAQVVRARLLRKSGRAEAAYRLSTEACRTIRAHRSKGLAAEAWLEWAESARACGRDPVPGLTGALRSLGGKSDPAFSWKVHAFRARGADGSEALRHYRKAVRAVFQARAMTRSSLARANFLNDKTEVVRDFLGLLLASGRKRDLMEALRWIRESRSSVLLDEILTSQDWGDAPWLAEFKNLREALGTMAQEPPDDRTRRAVPQDWTDLRRRWTDVLIETRSEIGRLSTERGLPDWILADTSAGPFLIEDGRSRPLPPTKALEEQLAWLRFEVLAPLVDRDADGTRAMASLEGLALSLGTAFERQGTVVCPDGAYWDVPWAALAALKGKEAVVALGPWGSGQDVRLGDGKNVAVWYHAPSSLPHIRSEVEAFLRSFPAARVCSTAREARQCLATDDVELLHVAGHASLHPDHPQFSAVHFEDGAISAAEISRSQLRAKIVVLSACETGSLSTHRPTEPEGLARSFLSRGARAVVTSIWPLDDHAASLFMYPFTCRLLDGGTVLDAVQAGRRAVREQYPHPYFWGPFTLYGGF